MCTCEIKSHIEGMKSRYAQTVIVGWAVSLKKRELEVQVTRRNQPVQGLCVEWTERPDILSAFFGVQEESEEAKEQRGGTKARFEALEERQAAFGFRIMFSSAPEETYRLVFSVKGDKRQRQVYTVKGEQAELSGAEGVKERLKRGVKRLSGRGEYRQNTQRDRNGDLRDVQNRGQSGGQNRDRVLKKGQGRPDDADEQGPLISIVVPVYRPEPVHFMEMLRSVMEQTYGKWQLCLADGSEASKGPENSGGSEAVDGCDGSRGLTGAGGSDGVRENAGSLEQLVREVSGGDERVVYRKLEQNLGISGNTNQALALAEGQWIAMVDHDDLLEPEALAEAVSLLQKESKAGFIYTDSDLTDMDGMKFYNALLKPDWSPETLYSANYITHFSMIRKDIIDAAGGFDPQMDGAQDWDIFFKASERAEVICHIPKVLYHWRVAKTSTARTVETKPYALDAQLRAINAHFRRMGYEAQAFFQDRKSYLIRVNWNRSVKWRMLQFEEKSGVRQTGQREEKSAAWTMPQQAPLVYIIDFGTVEPITEETCRELAQWAVSDGIGLVFPKLLDKEGRIVSAGITVTNGRGTVLYAGCKEHTADERGNTDWYRNVQAQAPSLCAVSAVNWEKYGAMEQADRETALTEYALRLSRAGLRHLMNPFAQAVCKI